MKVKRLLAAGLALAGLAGSANLHADEVSDWNQNLFTAIFTAKLTALVTTRVTALVQAAVFDAANGVYKRYTPVHVPPAAPNGASARAAVVQAAYASLMKLFPTQKPTLDLQLAASLANLADEDGTFGQSVERGLDLWAAPTLVNGGLLRRHSPQAPGRNLPT